MSDFAVGWLNGSQEQAKIIQKELEALFVVLEKTDEEQVTQQTAAHSEAAASAAQELSSQAVEMQHLVGTFQLNQPTAVSSPAVQVAAVLKAPRPAAALPAAPGLQAAVPMPAWAASGHRQPVAAVVPLADVPSDHEKVEVLQEF